MIAELVQHYKFNFEEYADYGCEEKYRKITKFFFDVILKKKRKLMKKYLILFCAIFVIAACDTRLSNSDLASQVISGLEEGYAGMGINIESLMLTRESSESNIYTGTMETTEPGGSFTYIVKVTYDGENITWIVEAP